MKTFLALPSVNQVLRNCFATLLAINGPLVAYAWYFAIKYSPLPGMPIQPFDGTVEMCWLSGAPLPVLIFALERNQKLLRRLGIFQITATLSVLAIPKF